MATRYSGDLKISVIYDDRGDYRTAVSRGGKLLWRGRINPAPAGFGRGVAYDSPKAYDEIAASALSFGSHELDERERHGGSDITDHAEMDDEGWKIRRVPRFYEQYQPGSSRRPRFARRDPAANGNPRRLKVGDVVYVRSDPRIVGTIKRLAYDTRTGAEGNALINLKRSRQTYSEYTHTAGGGSSKAASGFQLRGTPLSVETRELVLLVPKHVRGAKKARGAARRDPAAKSPEIMNINPRHPSGTLYMVKVYDPKLPRGYDLVDVLVHGNGAVSTKSANRSTRTGFPATRYVKRYREASASEREEMRSSRDRSSRRTRPARRPR